MTLEEDIQIADRMLADVDRLINEHRKNVLHAYLTLLASMTKSRLKYKSQKDENN